MQLGFPPAMKRAAGLGSLALASVALAGRTPLASVPPVEVLAPTHANQGRPRTVVRVHQPGRYALRVASPQGASLRVTDRMAGPDSFRGAPGNEDGPHR